MSDTKPKYEFQKMELRPSKDEICPLPSFVERENVSNNFVCVDCGAKVWTVEPHPTDRCTLHQAVFEQREKDAAIVRAKKVKLEQAIAQAPEWLHRSELVSAAKSMVDTLDQVAREIESLNPCLSDANPVITATDEKG